MRVDHIHIQARFGRPLRKKDRLILTRNVTKETF